VKRSLITLIAVLSVMICATGCASDTPKPTQRSAVDEAVRLVLVNDAKELARNLNTYQSSEGTYPQVSADEVQVTTQTILTAPVTVSQYQASSDSAWFCLVNPDADAWVSMNLTTNILRTTGKMCQQ
jgi:hypothetical protein